jgi:hypothetical protein
MKNQSRRLFLSSLVAFLPSLFLNSSAVAQFSPSSPGPWVTVQAAQPLAFEPGDHAGSFTISRGSDTNAAATITYTLAGSATNGVDYLTVPTSVTLAAGQSETNLLIAPVPEAKATAYKTVQLELPDTKGRFFGSARGYHSAVVYIAYNYANVAPTVTILSPTNDATFLSKPNIVILAKAGDSNGWVNSVEFLAGATSLGTVTNQPFPSGPFPPFAARKGSAALPPIVSKPQSSPFMVVWTNVTPGDYTLTAVATDNAGLQTTSAPIDLTVTTKLPQPAVRIVAPMTGSRFPSNACVNIVAAAGEIGGAIATVEFLAQGKSLGVVTNDPSRIWPWPELEYRPNSTNIPWTPFYFVWTNAPTGSNTITALATDNNGTLILSAPVTIDVLTNSYRPRRWW